MDYWEAFVSSWFITRLGYSLEGNLSLGFLTSFGLYPCPNQVRKERKLAVKPVRIIQIGSTTGDLLPLPPAVAAITRGTQDIILWSGNFNATFRYICGCLEFGLIYYTSLNRLAGRKTKVYTGLSAGVEHKILPLCLYSSFRAFTCME